jgi:serine/threonine protein kinase
MYVYIILIIMIGHDKGADHWSWAVLVYEMIIGTTPFYEDNIDQISLFKKIVHGKWTVPESNQWSTEANDLVERMIKRRPNQRLGGFVRGDLDIKEHAFFTGGKDSIDFTTLASKSLTAPWKPKLKNALDVSNFDNWDHMQKDNKKDKKLTSKEQSLFNAF